LISKLIVTLNPLFWHPYSNINVTETLRDRALKFSYYNVIKKIPNTHKIGKGCGIFEYLSIKQLWHWNIALSIKNGLEMPKFM